MSARLDFNAETVESIADLKARIDILDIVGRYASLKRRGGEYWAPCPLHADKTPSFKVNPTRQQFRCWGCGAMGDVLDFLEAAEGLTKGQAVERLRELAGGATADPAVVRAQAARRAAAAAQEAREAAQRTADARRIWRECIYLTRRDAPEAVAYLTERRGIPSWCSYHLRWHPYCPWGTGRTGCIVVACRDMHDEIKAIWRIRPVIEGGVERRGLGPVQGCLAPVMDDAGLDTIAIAEGVEDALAAAYLVNWPCLAALSAGNMAAAIVPGRFRHVLVVADADEVGTHAGVELARRLLAEGREARVIKPTIGKDASDTLLRMRRAA